MIRQRTIKGEGDEPLMLRRAGHKVKVFTDYWPAILTAEKLRKLAKVCLQMADEIEKE